MVLIDPSFFADDLLFDRVGVLRHELGHTLAFGMSIFRAVGRPRDRKNRWTAPSCSRTTIRSR
jgi:hypothetical protein